MTVTMQNIDASFLEVLKSLVKLNKNIVMKQIEDDSIKTEKKTSKKHIEQINAVYEKVPLEEQTFTCNASKTAIWEMIKDDTW